MFQTEMRIPFFIPVSGLRGCFSANGTDLYKPVCSQNLELVNLVPESRLPFSTYIVPFTLKRTGRPETGMVSNISTSGARGSHYLPFLGCEILNSVTPALFLPFPTLLELLPLTRLSSPASRTPPSAYSPRLLLPLSPTLNWVTLHY